MNGLLAPGPIGRSHQHGAVAKLEAIEAEHPALVGAVGLGPGRSLGGDLLPGGQRPGQVQAVGLRLGQQPRRLDHHRAQPQLLVQQAQDAKVDLGARHLGDLVSVGITQAQVPHRETIAAEGEPPDAELSLNLVVHSRHQLTPQKLAAPPRLQEQHRAAKEDRHHRGNHPDHPQRHESCAPEPDVSLFLLWSHPDSSQMRTDNAQRRR